MGKAVSAWERWVRSEPLEPGEVSPEVLASWERCRGYGLDPLGAPPAVVLSPEELTRRRRERKPLIVTARRLADRLASVWPACGFLLGVADPDGYLLEYLSKPGVTGTTDCGMGAGLPGENWSERVRGTNGIGTALATGEPVFLRGEDHYFASMRAWDCSGVPVRDPEGRLFGLLGLTGPTSEVSLTAHVLATAFAQELERELALCAAAKSLRLHNRRLALFNELEGLLAAKGDCVALHRELVRRLGRVEPRRTVALLKQDPVSGEAFIEALFPVRRTVVPGRWPLEGESLVARSFRAREAVLWTGGEIPSTWRIGHCRPQAMLAQPVVFGAHVFAVLLVAEPGPPGFSSDDLRWYEAVARRLAAHFEKDRLDRELVTESNIRRTILEQMDVGIVVIDLDRGRLTWNQPMAKFFTPEGGSVCQEKGIPRPDRVMKYPLRFAERDMGDILERVVSAHETVTDEAVVFCDPPVTFRVTTGPVCSPCGRVEFILQTYTDITFRRRLERQKAELVAMISHELRTPLTGIKGYAQLLRQRLPEDEALQHLLGGLLRDTEELSALVERVVVVNQLELDRGLCVRRVSLRTVLARVARRLEAERSLQGVSLEIEGPDLTLTGDPEALELIFANLIQNAIKFSPRGGRVTVRLAREGAFARAEVSDGGPGISPEYHEAIFERFYRVPSRETVNVPGSGLGLYIVRRLVERHGGRVKVDSELGRGSTFTVILPEEVGEDDAASDPRGG